MTDNLPSLASLRVWQRLNAVSFTGCCVGAAPGKGCGLFAEQNLEQTGTLSNPYVLARVPRNLVLDSNAVELYAKQDSNFRLLLDAMGHKTTRGDVLTFLLVQLFLSQTINKAERFALSNPWTEYVSFLPADVPLPTLWSDEERLLLQGTSLEAAVEAKIATLQHEFDRLREVSSAMPYWQSAFWDREDGPQLRHWFLADAWYRSRCLELPRSGEGMVPCIDMINHSATPNAFYEDSIVALGETSLPESDSAVALLLRPGHTVQASNEITISYAGSGRGNGTVSEKTAAEMLFSYGFVDSVSAPERVVIPFRPLPDDPLAKAKLHVFGNPPPTIEIEILCQARGEDADETNVLQAKWTCPFAYLMCVNEEDGLDFRICQETNGAQELRMFWQDEDMTDKARNFESLTATHSLAPVFQLRVVAVVEELLAAKLERIQATSASFPHPPTSMDNDHNTDEEPDVVSGWIREDIAQQATALRDIESRILSSGLQTLETSRTDLLSNEVVVAYLGSMEVSQNELVEEEAPNQGNPDETTEKSAGDDDFS